MNDPAPSRSPFDFLFVAMVFLLATACGGGSGGGAGGGSAFLGAPSGLAYSTNPVVTTVGKALTPDTPSSGGGAVTSYTVQAALPAGLTLDPATGVLGGTPSAATAAATYTVTAANSVGNTTAMLALTVNVPPIASFSVGADQTLTYPNNQASPPYLVDLPDEHTTFIPLSPPADGYLVFAASRVNTVPTGGGAVVLQTTDLSTFQFATALGYNEPVMTAPAPFTQCQPAYATEFDENYAGPGAVVQDPTLPAGNLIMLFEAENHCPGGVNQTPYYATVGFTRSADNGAYLMTFFSKCSGTGAWYYATATSLALQDWSQPQMIANSQGPFTTPCTGRTTGGSFDGLYPSFMSPGAAAGHTKLTGNVFFLNGCDQGARTFMGRTYTITLGAPSAAAKPPLEASHAPRRRIWREVRTVQSRTAYQLPGRFPPVAPPVAARDSAANRELQSTRTGPVMSRLQEEQNDRSIALYDGHHPQW